MEQTETKLNLVVRPGTIPVWSGSNRRASIYCRVSDGRTPNQNYLSFTGVIGPLPSGDALGGSGQIDMEFAHRDPADNDHRYEKPIQPSEFRWAKGWDAKRWQRFLDLWKQWHLKDRSKVPDAVIAELAALPPTDKDPAWV